MSNGGRISVLVVGVFLLSLFDGLADPKGDSAMNEALAKFSAITYQEALQAANALKTAAPSFPDNPHFKGLHTQIAAVFTAQKNLEAAHQGVAQAKKDTALKTRGQAIPVINAAKREVDAAEEALQKALGPAGRYCQTLFSDGYEDPARNFQVILGRVAQKSDVKWFPLTLKKAEPANPTNDPDVIPELIVVLEGGGSKTLKDVKLHKIEADGVGLRHSAGFVRVPFENLPQDLQKRWASQWQEANKWDTQAVLELFGRNPELALKKFLANFSGTWGYQGSEFSYSVDDFNDVLTIEEPTTKHYVVRLLENEATAIVGFAYQADVKSQGKVVQKAGQYGGWGSFPIALEVLTGAEGAGRTLGFLTASGTIAVAGDGLFLRNNDGVAKLVRDDASEALVSDATSEGSIDVWDLRRLQAFRSLIRKEEQRIENASQVTQMATGAELQKLIERSPDFMKVEQYEKDEFYAITGNYGEPHFQMLQVTSDFILIADAQHTGFATTGVLIPQNPEALGAVRLGTRQLSNPVGGNHWARSAGVFVRFEDVKMVSGATKRLPVFVIPGLLTPEDKFIRLN